MIPDNDGGMLVFGQGPAPTRFVHTAGSITPDTLGSGLPAGKFVSAAVRDTTGAVYDRKNRR